MVLKFLSICISERLFGVCTPVLQIVDKDLFLNDCLYVFFFLAVLKLSIYLLFQHMILFLFLLFLFNIHSNNPIIIKKYALFFYRPAHLFTPVAAIYFGNMVNNGKFLVHFRRTCPNDLNIILQQSLVFSKLINEEVDYPMVVNFEYDRNLCIIRFAVLDGIVWHKFSRIDIINQ